MEKMKTNHTDGKNENHSFNAVVNNKSECTKYNTLDE
jgi:hypothetical protein